MTTFADLGLEFPLFQAQLSDAAEYGGIFRCSLCSTEGHCFLLGIGSYLVVHCDSCGEVNFLDADDRDDSSCRSCGRAVLFPVGDESPIHVCYSCLRAGRAAITKDTEFGMVSWEQAVAGVTHGVPGLRTEQFPLVDTGDGWLGAVVASQHLFELLHTPTPSTIQGEQWQFCCQQPMPYVGRWEREDLSRRASDGNGSAYLDRLLGEHVPGLWEDQLHDITGIYVFRCSKCGREVATWDIA